MKSFSCRLKVLFSKIDNIVLVIEVLPKSGLNDEIGILKATTKHSKYLVFQILIKKRSSERLLKRFLYKQYYFLKLITQCWL